MSALRSGIDELAGLDLAFQSHEQIQDDVVEISRAMDRLGYELARRVDEARRRGEYAADGFLSATRWLATIARLDNATASRIVREGEFFRRNRATAERAASGDLSRSRVRLLRRAYSAHKEAYANDEEMLLGFAADLEMHDLKEALDYWRSVVDDTAEKSAAEKREKAYLHASTTLGGMVRVDGLLDPQRGEALLTALEKAAGPRAEDDHRPASNRRAEALETICLEWMANGGPNQGGPRVQVSLIVDLETLMGQVGRTSRLRHTGTVTPETARELCCDANVSRVITNGDSVPLDMGRSVRVVTAAQRRALEVRDGGCRAPGCDRPASWCDAHHIRHWLDGGPTDLDNLRLLCRRHHTLVHLGVVKIE